MHDETIDSLVTAIQENTKPEIIQPERGDFEQTPVAIVPKGMDLKSLKPFLDEYRIKPDRRKGTIVADDLTSFTRATNRFKSADSVVFARAEIGDTAISAQLTAILDYHPATSVNTDAAFAGFQVSYRFPLSKDFRFWLGSNNKKLGQLEFAHFLEDRIHDLSAVEETDKDAVSGLAPSFADPLVVLQLSRDLEINSTETFRSKNKLSSGEMELKFTSEHKDSSGQPVKIPEFFVIQLPLFAGGSAVRILVRLRYRVNQDKITWWYELYRVDMALEAAFDDACVEVEEATSLPLFHGAAEPVQIT